MPAATTQTNSTAPVFNVITSNSDLLLPRFGKDRSLNADDYVNDFRTYVKLWKIPIEDAVLVFHTRMTGTVRTWIETVSEELSLEEHIASFKERFSVGGDSCRSALMAEFWKRRQRADEKTADYIEDKARLARRLRVPDKRFIVEAATQGMREKSDATYSSRIRRPSRHSPQQPTSPTPANAPAATYRTETMRHLAHT